MSDEQIDFNKVIENIETASLLLKSSAIELGKSNSFDVSIKNLKETIGDLECSALILKSSTKSPLD